MNFADLKFWLLLSACLLGCVTGRLVVARWAPRWVVTWDRLGLLLTGWILLLSVGVLTFGIFLWVALVTYVGVGALQRLPSTVRLRWLILLVPLQLGPLFYYKYGDFVCNGVLGLELSKLAGLVIPAGISFYSFQKVSFAVDTLSRDQKLPRFLDYMNFAGFFPLVVAGPIERKSDLLPQMERFRFDWNAANLNRGAEWIVLGMFLKMVLADNLAQLFHPSGASNAYAIWYANVLFGLRIYFDFAGYSLVALGIAGCLGVRLTVNFLSPYCASSVSEFWRRWHVSLSQWFRDYLYIPLGGGRTRFWVLNVLLVFVISGVWHGAGWNFVLWGLLHASYLIVDRWIPPGRLPRLLARAGTLLAVFLAWLPFYETRSGPLLEKLRVLVTPSHYGLGHLREFAGQIDPSDLLLAATVLTLSGAVFLGEGLSLRRGGEVYSILRRPAVLVSMVVMTVWLAPANNNAFIYFAF